MDADFVLHDPYHNARDEEEEDDIDVEPGADDILLENNDDDDDDIVQILALANRLFFLGNQFIQGRLRNNPPVPNVVFNLDLYDEAKSEMEFRFHVDEIYNIGAWWEALLPSVRLFSLDGM
ncbi:hypothetical protein BGZ58_003284, partial [Dissophora ornata]